ncbi:TPA: DUF4921 family protein [Candidatus Bathyarchaeota archaeon]|nr:DUF4921 family protein [Candidatus Bathyarchaeota archaeon]
MLINEMRKDYILDRWVVIATQRKRRPVDFVKARVKRKPSLCPFCPGNEHMTPPATLVYLKRDGKIIKDKDQNGTRHKDWLVRCVPNLYPAFTSPSSQESRMDEAGEFEHVKAVGHHEVIIESPNHDEHPSVAKISQMVLVLNAYQDRLEALSSRKYVKYVSIFRNHGSDAGASLSHAHTQIMAAPILPRIVKEELNKCVDFWNENGKCVFCDIIEKEKEGPRLIWENESFLVFAPWASVHPFEFWIFPKRHQSTILKMNSKDIRELAVTFRASFGGLRSLLGDPSYNFGFHMISHRSFHWHLEVYPRLTVWAGFEKSTGIFINVVSPEEAASDLKEAIIKEIHQKQI